MDDFNRIFFLTIMLRFFACGLAIVLLFADSIAMEDGVKNHLRRKLNERVQKIAVSLDSSNRGRSLQLCDQALAGLGDDMDCTCASSMTIDVSCSLREDVCPEEENGKKVCFAGGSKVITMNIDLVTFSATASTCVTFKEVTEKPDLAGKEMCLKMSGLDINTIVGGGGSSDKLPFSDCEFTLTGQTCTCEVCSTAPAMNVECDSKSISTCSMKLPSNSTDPTEFGQALARSLTTGGSTPAGAPPTAAPTTATTPAPTGGPVPSQTSASKILPVSGIFGLAFIGFSLLI